MIALFYILPFMLGFAFGNDLRLEFSSDFSLPFPGFTCGIGLALTCLLIKEYHP